MNSIKLNNNPLNLDLTLPSGQAFRWRKKNNLWHGYINNTPCTLSCENDILYYKNSCEQDIINYFQLNTDLNIIYKELTESDKNIEPLIEKYYGLRILRQNTEETLYSFLCSAANAIPKIMAGIEKFCSLFPENAKGNNKFSFPDTDQIVKNSRENMRAIKEIAFRGGNIFDTACIIKEKDNFFESLKNMDYENAKKTLTEIKNIGPKIADCICLFSMDFPFVVPVDTHVRQIAIKKFDYKMKSNSISKKDYAEIQKIFTDTYGQNAGLAQQFLFFNEL